MDTLSWLTHLVLEVHLAESQTVELQKHAKAFTNKDVFGYTVNAPLALA